MASPGTVTPLQSTALAAPLLAVIDELADELVRRILAEEHAYAESSVLSPAQLRRACVDNVGDMVRDLAGVRPIDLESAKAAGRLKADQGVPLAALLHAFRLGGRLVWEELMNRSEGEAPRELLEMAAQVWALIDVASDAAAEAYRVAVDARAEQDADARTRLVRALFADHGTDSAFVADALRTFRIPDRGSFVVVSADSRCADISEPGVDAVWDSAVDGVVGLLFAQSHGKLESALDGIADEGGNVGISAVFTAAVGIPKAVEQARSARRCAPVNDAPATRYDAVPIPLLLVDRPEGGLIAAKQILGSLLDLPEDERTSLLSTLDAWFEAKGSTAEASNRLHYHRNTVLYRLRRIGELTGRDFLNPVHSAELFVGLRAYQLCSGGVVQTP
ncbi:PucR family transcriptional regulator [Rhodococcus sp. P1Y]|uniref:PucR family transcriptional regulator n=1 Tax=Rhodococcus sp. P1Y TaxID=1302308 RepID=UPI000EAF1596|nr:PucR family transcriptional regulator [Rhodococcus sp. P1Y]AYJ47981.1 PucR family transcriptional regulator [Rhodococcus sp. P1Y]